MRREFLNGHRGAIEDRASQLVTLWTVFLLATLFHTQLALMPLFHGMGVDQTHTEEAVGFGSVMWFMLLFFCLPLLAMVGCRFYHSRKFRLFHFGLTLVYSCLNLMHVVLDAVVAVPGYQLALMLLLFGIGLLLNWVSFRWLNAVERPIRAELQR